MHVNNDVLEPKEIGNFHDASSHSNPLARPRVFGLDSGLETPVDATFCLGSSSVVYGLITVNVDNTSPEIECVVF